MTTLILQTAGRMIGGAIAGPFGSMIGSTLGASAGYMIDQHIFGGAEGSHREGPRLSDLQVQASTEGADIPRIYGRARSNGQIIWATNYVEKANKRVEKTGAGKAVGAPGKSSSQTTYSYYANFAVGLCEGEIAYIGRIWANGTLLDQEKVTFRVYRGTQDQQPDSLIEAKQGADNAPAYRGLAYIVFEELPLEDYGNRIPQLAFEIVKPVGSLEKQITSMVMLPGATEFGYDPDLVQVSLGEGQDKAANKHSLEIGTDFSQSLDHLQAVCPNLKQVALVVSWFGNDLRASHCSIEPKCDASQKAVISGQDWAVADLSRSQAQQVSQTQGCANYGGTPSDGSVIRAIEELHNRGLKVVLYPFVMMDIPANNSLEDPYGASEQAAHPWRGRITCHPAPGQPASADKTALATDQMQHFFVDQEWSYRRFLLHYANLAKQAGGVEAFLIGSEFRGLTTCRDSNGSHPAVGHLKDLAGRVRQILGVDCKLTYGADWSEYFGHHPDDEPGTIVFHLDPLWADANIDAIGIDNYMPLTDWRKDRHHLDSQRAATPYEKDYLQSRIAGGEGFDWYYKNTSDRENQIRSPIQDGAYQKPWVYRYKDLVNWWSNHHFNRQSGIEAVNPTAWQPKSKPIWFTEIGCAAVHLGSNQPNKFPDPKSAEDALPHHSNGARDDFAQRSMLDAVLDYWQQQGSTNPVSPTYNQSMVDPDNIYLWAWDARPFPAFPQQVQTWSDGANWFAGHWLNGRLGAAPLPDLLSSIFKDFALPTPDIKAVSVALDGFVIDRRMSARAAMEGLLKAFGLTLSTAGEKVTIRGGAVRPHMEIERVDLVDVTGQAVQTNHLAPDYDMPSSISLAYQDIMLDFRQVIAKHALNQSAHKNDQAIALPVIATLPEMEKQAQNWMQRASHARHQLDLVLPPSLSALEAGDCIVMQEKTAKRCYLIEEIEEGDAREVRATLIPDQDLMPNGTNQIKGRQVIPTSQPNISRPIVEILDLPLLPDRLQKPHAPYIAAYAKPWPASVQIYQGAAEEGYRLLQSLELPAILGRLTQSLDPALPDRWSNKQSLYVSLLEGQLASVTEKAVLNGANAAAIKARNGEWEIVQFQKAELIAPRRWRLDHLLRGQLGSRHAALAGADAQTRFILLDDAVQALESEQSQLEQTLNLRAVPQGTALSGPACLSFQAKIKGRGLWPLAPVHLKRTINPLDQEWHFSWIRQDRLQGDSWVGEEIPLSEVREAYRLQIWSEGVSPTLLTEQMILQPNWSYSQASRLADGVNEHTNIVCKVQQISALTGPGLAIQESFHV